MQRRDNSEKIANHVYCKFPVSIMVVADKQAMSLSFNKIPINDSYQAIPPSMCLDLPDLSISDLSNSPRDPR